MGRFKRGPFLNDCHVTKADTQLSKFIPSGIVGGLLEPKNKTPPINIQDVNPSTSWTYQPTKFYITPHISDLPPKNLLAHNKCLRKLHLRFNPLQRLVTRPMLCVRLEWGQHPHPNNTEMKPSEKTWAWLQKPIFFSKVWAVYRPKKFPQVTATEKICPIFLMDLGRVLSIWSKMRFDAQRNIFLPGIYRVSKYSQRAV